MIWRYKLGVHSVTHGDVDAFFVFQIKEIAPEKSLPDTDRFWKHDIKVAREYNRRNTTVGSTGDMAQTVLSEWAVSSLRVTNIAFSDVAVAGDVGICRGIRPLSTQSK